MVKFDKQKSMEWPKNKNKNKNKTPKEFEGGGRKNQEVKTKVIVSLHLDVPEPLYFTFQAHELYEVLCKTLMFEELTLVSTGYLQTFCFPSACNYNSITACHNDILSVLITLDCIT